VVVVVVQMSNDGGMISQCRLRTSAGDAGAVLGFPGASWGGPGLLGGFPLASGREEGSWNRFASADTNDDWWWGWSPVG
jgi:hypothetical protein